MNPLLRLLSGLPLALLLLLTGCDGDTFRLLATVELVNRTGFTVEVLVGETLKVSRLPNGGTAEFETTSGRRPLLVRDLGSGLAIIDEQYRFRDDVTNRIDLSDARAVLELTQAADCCVRIRVDGRQVAEVGGISTREVLVPAGTRSVDVLTCAGVLRRNESRVFLTGGRTTVNLTAADCPD